MSEEIENVENDEVEQLSPIETFINAVSTKDFVSANKEFDELMSDKIHNSLEQEKINIASQMYNGSEDEDDDGLPSDVEPEQIEDDEDEEEDHIENDAEDEDYDDDTEEDSETEHDDEESEESVT